MLSWLNGKKLGGAKKRELSFEQKLALAHSLQGKNAVIAGTLCPVVGLREETAEVEVWVWGEKKVYDPADLVVDQYS